MHFFAFLTRPVPIFIIRHKVNIRDVVGKLFLSKCDEKFLKKLTIRGTNQKTTEGKFGDKLPAG